MSLEINGIELKNVHRITTFENGGFIQHHVLGMDGNLCQDIGRQSLQLQIDGIFYGKEIEKELKALRDVFLKREPVEFLAQIKGQAYAAKVVIDSLRVMESNEQPDQYVYQINVFEYIQPPDSTAINLDKIDSQVKLEALQIVDIMEIPDLLSLGSIPELSNPIEPLKGVLTPVQEASTALLESAMGLQSLLGSSN